MTDKRFTVVYDDIVDLGHIYDKKDEKYFKVGTLDRTETICELLNELHDENKELKEGVEELNEICKYYEMRIKEFDSENQHIKNLITEAYANERTQLGRNVLKQLLDQME